MLKENTGEKRKKTNLKRTFKNNMFMLGLIAKCCPGILVVSLISTILSATQSFLTSTYLYKYALNALQQGKTMKSILITLAFMILFYIFCYVYYGLLSCYYQIKAPRIDAYIQTILQKKAVEVDLACFENSAFYDTYVKATGEAAERAFTVLNNILEVVYVTLNVAAVATLIFTIDPIFLVLAVVPLLVTLFVGKKRNRVKYTYDMETKVVARQRDYVRRTFYLKDFSKEMRLTDMSTVMFRRMHDSISQMKDIANKYGYKMMWFRYLFNFVFDVVVSSGTITLAAYKTLVLKNLLLGDCFVVINSISTIAENLNGAGDTIFKLDENSLYIDNLRDFLEYDIKIPENEDAPPVRSFETLELKNVSFTYQNQTEPTLQNINLSINAGEKIAIVGHNGAGKTTLIKLLQRLYDPNDGEIILNGGNVKNYRLSSYRDLFGTVFQDYMLFAVSVAENVMLCGDLQDCDKNTAADALSKSGILSKIESLKLGIDTTVTKEFDKEGAVFSGGEAQKIAIARIFASNCEIVIMDEPTSALDPIAEQEMYRNMFDCCEGKTVIFISHRLSSATMADRVYMFENGQIIEQGTHEELLALDRQYADMWHKQADTYAENLVQEVTA